MKCESCQQAEASMRVNREKDGHQISSCLCSSCFEQFMITVERRGMRVSQRAKETSALSAQKTSSILSVCHDQPVIQHTATPLLNQYGRDLTAAASQGKLAPIPGRHRELQRIMTILGRHQKSNPLLIGEPGVGKTAIVEGLAAALSQRTVPAHLLGKRVVSLNPASLVAGAAHRGQLEQRVHTLLDELRMHPDIIIFIDELHTIVGRDAASGTSVIGDLLKPALARGELRFIGATTVEEYRRFFERDAALKRRFQPVLVDEPSVEETRMILQGMLPTYEKHHGVQITQEAIEAAIKLSSRYIPERFLPDKAIDVIDEAGAAFHMRADQKEGVSLVIGPEHIAQVVENWTGIPVGQVLENERHNLRNLEKDLSKRVIGQDAAIRLVARSIRRARAGLKDPHRPIASFLFLGSTGVGKTELAKALAANLFGSEQRMIRLDMSEYMEEHSVARLFGSPPGYVGHNDGGQLTEQVRSHPYSILLCDEIEKAHPMVLNTFLQVLEDGRLTDGKGHLVDFKNTVIILTSNVGAVDFQRARGIGFIDRQMEEAEANEQLSPGVQRALKQAFRPEFVNRIDQIIAFRRLGKNELYRIVDLLLAQVCARLQEQDITLFVPEQVRDFLLHAGYDEEYGARPLRRVIQNFVDDLLADAIVNGEIVPGQTIVLTLQDDTPTIEVQDASVIEVRDALRSA